MCFATDKNAENSWMDLKYNLTNLVSFNHQKQIQVQIPIEIDKYNSQI